MKPLDPPEPLDPLDPDRTTREAWLRAVARFAQDHLDGLPTASAAGCIGAQGQAIADAVSRPIPDRPLPGGIDEAIEVLSQAVQGTLATNGPGYLAYVPGGGLYAAAIADFAAGCVNRFTGLTSAAPALVRLETDVLSWLATEFGYGPKARGLLTSGGSLANFSAIVTARHHRLGDDGRYEHATAYTSTQVHHSVARSVTLAGIPKGNLRAVAVDDRFRMIPEALDRAIATDLAAGRRPFLTVSSAGTTNTGAVDPLPEIAEVCAKHDVWHHVDGAYGGAFALCAPGRQALMGIERGDSITFDPHKGLFLPYGTGCLLVADGARLRRAHHADAGYLQDFAALDRRHEAPSPTEHGPELSRDFRGLRLWLCLMLHGADAFREALTEKLALAQRFERGLQTLIADGAPLEIVDSPQLSTVPFRLRREPDEALADHNRRNASFMDRINARGRVYLSSTTLPVADGDAFTLRVCILSFRTHADRIDAAVQDVAAALSMV